MEASELQERQDFALKAAHEAGIFTLKYFQNDQLTVEQKADASPVTEADRGAEKIIRGHIEANYPDDAILGEEFGEKAGTSGNRWILDPIDGTKSFIHGVPLYGTMIGMEADGEAVSGVIYFPALGEIVYAAKGLGAFWVPKGVDENVSDIKSLARPAKVSSVKSLDQSLYCLTSHRGKPELFHALDEACLRFRGWGDCYGHMLVATGRAEIMLDPITMNIWDCCPLKPIVEEAGGRFTDIQGNLTVDGGSGLSTNGYVHDAVLGIASEFFP